MILFSKASKSGLSPSTNHAKEQEMENILMMQKKKQSQNSFRLGFLRFLKINFLHFLGKNSFRERLFLKGQSLVYQEIDILQIMRKIQEIEKLKYILLNKSQLCLFDLLEKPIVSISRRAEITEEEASPRYLGGSSLKQLREKKIKESFLEILKSDNKSETDTKILELLDKETKEFLGGGKKP